MGAAHFKEETRIFELGVDLAKRRSETTLGQISMLAHYQIVRYKEASNHGYPQLTVNNLLEVPGGCACEFAFRMALPKVVQQFDQTITLPELESLAELFDKNMGWDRIRPAKSGTKIGHRHYESIEHFQAKVIVVRMSVRTLVAITASIRSDQRQTIIWEPFH